MSENGACWRCRWYESAECAENDEAGCCHRYPPQMVVSDGDMPTTSWFPAVSCMEYCGEFEEATDE